MFWADAVTCTFSNSRVNRTGSTPPVNRLCDTFARVCPCVPCACVPAPPILASMSDQSECHRTCSAFGVLMYNVVYPLTFIRRRILMAYLCNDDRIKKQFAHDINKTCCCTYRSGRVHAFYRVRARGERGRIHPEAEQRARWRACAAAGRHCEKGSGQAAPPRKRGLGAGPS